MISAVKYKLKLLFFFAMSAPWLFTSCTFTQLRAFQPDIHQLATANRTAASMVENRLRPATLVAGKQWLILEDCRNITLMNNLDIQVARQDEQTKRQLRNGQMAQMLPHAAVSGQLSDRDNIGWSYSEVIAEEGLSASTAPRPVISFPPYPYRYANGRERSTWRYSAEFRWSPVEALTAFYRTKSRSNQRISAYYERIKRAQKVLGRTESSFFRLLALQEALPMAARLKSIRSDIVDKRAELIEKKLVNIEEYNDAVQRYIRARRIYVQVRNDLEKQRNFLASSMGLSPDYTIDGGFYVAGKLEEPGFRAEMADLEAQAVRTRPELYIAGLENLSSENDLKASYIKYAPQVTGFYRYNRDKDKFLLDKEYAEYGMNFRVDLFDWIGASFEGNAAQSNIYKTRRDLTRVALEVSLEVRDTFLKYFDALEQVQNSAQSVRMARRVLEVARHRSATGAADKVREQEAGANLLEAKIERVSNLGEAAANLALLYAAMGVNYQEPVPQD
ncbi:TolC family protein [Desulfomonile tiedjei]|uniref:Outer membrane protein n=1 Tax=Desulfomonile tiedjei (strain ATCC 49306 / DSM 6799 / DCB-1) TaxID=706587 RepID=I4C9R6_DESTA|nr:TolC family protein [Desulfomonile tiedjei]AFM26307.1 outer membrane protein [Desulfomonile tiedjei DSM 6799]